MVPILEPVIEAIEESPKERSLLMDDKTTTSGKPPPRPLSSASATVIDLLKQSTNTQTGATFMKVWSEDEGDSIIGGSDREDESSAGLRRSAGTLAGVIAEGGAGIDVGVDDWEGDGDAIVSSQGSSAFYIGDGSFVYSL